MFDLFGMYGHFVVLLSYCLMETKGIDKAGSLFSLIQFVYHSCLCIMPMFVNSVNLGQVIILNTSSGRCIKLNICLCETPHCIMLSCVPLRCRAFKYAYFHVCCTLFCCC